MKRRYVGHCNIGTDIKQASFLGQRGKFLRVATFMLSECNFSVVERSSLQNLKRQYCIDFL